MPMGQYTEPTKAQQVFRNNPRIVGPAQLISAIDQIYSAAIIEPRRLLVVVE